MGLTDRQANGLLQSYVERKQWEAKLLSAMIINRLGEALTPQRKQASLASLAAMGFKIEGA